MIWPGNLVVATNLNTFHAEEDGFTGGMSRFKFLMVCIAGSFAYYFFPGKCFGSIECGLTLIASSRLYFHGFVVFLMGLLDCTKE